MTLEKRKTKKKKVRYVYGFFNKGAQFGKGIVTIFLISRRLYATKRKENKICTLPEQSKKAPLV